MAAKRRHWKEKDGRFWARMAVPKALQQILGKSELVEALGGDRRIAVRNHAAAVARLQARITQAGCMREPILAASLPEPPLRAITVADRARIVWVHYDQTLLNDEMKRAAMPTQAHIEDEYEQLMQRIEAGELDAGQNPMGAFNINTDYELLFRARRFDENIRTRRLAALRLALATGDTRMIDATVQHYLSEHGLMTQPGSTEWRDLAHLLSRAEIDALERTLERDRGNFGGVPSDPIVKPAVLPVEVLAPVSLERLFADYIATRQAVGKHQDGGANWRSVVRDLIMFLKHEDARKITKRNLLDWRSSLLAAGKSPKTISDKHLAAIGAILRWAFENDILPSNEAKDVRQELPKKLQTREKGYTTEEAVKVLRASLNHQPAERSNPANQERAHLTAAKRWVPLLCAFTGARITEMTQLRREDVKKDGERWVLRITPDAGSVKTGQYRDVPLHHQVVALGFIAFVDNAGDGPLFHGATSQERYLASARGTAGKLSAWLNDLKLVPLGVAPLYGWRHRFKTQGLELGASTRVLDAIQGHPGKSASDGYGDVTVTAKLKVIDLLADYEIG